VGPHSSRCEHGGLARGPSGAWGNRGGSVEATPKRLGEKVSRVFQGKGARVKRSLTRDFQLQFFFHESVSPGPLSIPLG
jgi:hypothetical protein